MNLDLSIARMAFREAPTLGVAQVLVVQKRAALENELVRIEANDGGRPMRGMAERIVTDMEAVSDLTVKALRHRLDRVA